MRFVNQYSSAFRSLPERSRGLSLIELLVSTAIGIFVVGGVLVLYMNAQESAAYLDSASRVQENGRFAADYMARTLRMAGYDDPMTTGTVPATPALQGTTSDDIGGTLNGVALKSSTDVVLISHEGAPQVRDCRGVEVATDTWVTNTYAVSNANELVCGTVTRAGTVQVSSDPLVIAEGIEDLLISYGVDADGDGLANSYVAEDAVGDWSQIVSARFAILVNSVDRVFADSLHGCESCSTFNPVTDDLLRAEFHATVSFRNLRGT